MRPELGEINHKQIGVGGRGGDLPEKKHPWHLNAHAAPEGGAGVEVGASGLLEMRGDLGETAEDYAHANSGQKHGHRAEFSENAGDGGGEPEYAAADDGIHHQRGEAPAADGAEE